MLQISSAFASLSLSAVLLLAPAAGAQTDGLDKSSRKVLETPLSTSELTASDGVAGNALGLSIAVSGNTVVVGEDCGRIGGNSNCDENHQGVVYVYQKPKGGWNNMTQTARLTPSDGYVGDEFGTSVAISGTTIVIGARDGSKAYVFVRPRGGWHDMSETAQLINPTAGDIFGNVVAIDKDTIIVGVPNVTVNGNQSQGAAFVYVEPATGWATTSTFNAELTASDGSFQNLFGLSAAVSGNTIVIGSPFHNDQTGPGEAYVFVKPVGGWTSTTETAILTRSPQGPFDEFGFAVAISGNTVVVGAPQAVGVNNGQGVVDIFVKPSKGWVDKTERAELVAPIPIQHFGFSIAVKGKNVVVGTFGPTNIVFEYTKPQGGWKSTSQDSAELTAGDGVSFFGFSVGMTGSVIVAGAPFQTVDGNADQGAAYVFSQ